MSDKTKNEGPIQVIVIKIPGGHENVSLVGEKTIAAAIKTIKGKTHFGDILVNGELNPSIDTELKNGDKIAIIEWRKKFKDYHEIVKG